MTGAEHYENLKSLFGADNVKWETLKKGAQNFEADAYSYYRYKQTLVKEEVLSYSKEIIRGDQFGDKKMIAELTKDGSSIKEWSKMESINKYTNEYGTGKIHYYKNIKSGQVSFYDAKMKIPSGKIGKNLQYTTTDKEGFWIIDLDENFIPKGLRK